MLNETAAHLQGAKDFCSGGFEGIITLQDLLKRHEDCCGLNCSILLWDLVTLQFFASKQKLCTCVHSSFLWLLRRLQPCTVKAV